MIFLFKNICESKIHLFQECLTKLKNNENVVTPYYDYENDVIVKQCREIESAKVSMIFVEGMFIFKIPKLREFFDFNIFVEVDDDIRLSRMCKKISLIVILTENFQYCMKINS